MQGEIFNANPTIFAPSKPSGRANRLNNARSLWMVDPSSDDTDDEGDSPDEVEEIDQDEIFGESSTLHL